MKQFERLRLVDQWGFYCLRRPKGSPRIQHNGEKYWEESSPVLRKDQELLVRFPDGSEDRVRIEAKCRRSSTTDHGHEYEAKWDEWGFWVELRGLKLWVGLSCVDVDVSGLQWGT